MHARSHPTSHLLVCMSLVLLLSPSTPATVSVVLRRCGGRDHPDFTRDRKGRAFSLSLSGTRLHFLTVAVNQFEVVLSVPSLLSDTP